METSQAPLSIESFSYSWLVNLKPSLETVEFDSSLDLGTSLDAASDELANSFIEMDPRMPPSKRFSKKNSKDFKFDFPTSDSLTFVHADELFSNGYLMPFFVDSMKKDMHKPSDNSANSNLPSSSSLSKKKSSIPSGLFRSRSLRRCGRLSKRLLEKYLDFFIPLYRRVLKGHNHKSRGSTAENFDKFDRRVQSLQTMRSWMYSSETSPRISVSYSADDWRRSCDSDSSIYEAVLHCKRSIEK